MVIGQFFNSLNKNINNDTKVIVDKIVKVYSIGNKTHETNEKDVIVPKVSHLEVMQAIQKIHLYEKQYKNGDSK